MPRISIDSPRCETNRGDYTLLANANWSRLYSAARVTVIINVTFPRIGYDAEFDHQLTDVQTDDYFIGVLTWIGNQATTIRMCLPRFSSRSGAHTAISAVSKPD